MKKKIILSLLVIVSLITITGCAKKRTIEYLLDGYVRAYTKADLEAAKDIFPPFYLEYSKNSLTQDYMDSTTKQSKEKYGDDFNITYKITKTTKMTKKELEEHNKKMTDYYKSDKDATECYKYEGKITFKGSKKSDELSISTIAYCKYEGEWYIVRK